MVERKSREVLLFKLSSQTQIAVDRALNGLERKLGGERFRETFKSITVDNVAEFWNWELLEQSVVSPKRRTTLYYAHPYSSWERGSNENMNGFVRYSIPKGTRIRDWTRQKIQKLNETSTIIQDGCSKDNQQQWFLHKQLWRRQIHCRYLQNNVALYIAFQEFINI